MYLDHSAGVISAKWTKLPPMWPKLPFCDINVFCNMFYVDVALQMVRKYAAKGKRLTWNVENMQRAITDVENKTFTIRAASRAYGIPRTTIQDAMRKRNETTGSREYVSKKIGRKPMLGEVFESELKDYAMKMSALYYGVTKQDLCKLAYQVAERNKISHSFNEDRKMAGTDWFYGFLKRNPDLTMRIPEATSLSRVIGFRRSEVNRFYDNLRQVFATGIEPGRIYNVDETGVSTVPTQRDAVLAQKGCKQVAKATSAERGVTITVVGCISATGVYIPPMMIFPRKNFSKRLMIGAPPGAIGDCSPSGWINSELFIVWLKHFIKASGASMEKKMVLLMDNHESHISLGAFELCRSSGITVVSFAPHTSHRCQPLDLTVYGPLKTAYQKRCSDWMACNVGQRIRDENVAALFSDAYCKIATVDKCVSGFRAAGIWPLNSAVFGDEDYAAADHLLHGRSLANQSRGDSSTAVSSADVQAEGELTSNVGLFLS